ncbi:NAD(P)-dependent alcohol dehydrogenase [Demequina sp. NBRC 110053]|uniref:NAD(P)-dependent alcohol dehydrogenase n=1 Tax=Demequina sp. NBRC 110053 TaxID=1570342 RepID=UPI000A00B562|nr:NAD(P)-dependent alcohol dehydrogenase [Demequina sp. NBRC 110053]
MSTDVAAIVARTPDGPLESGTVTRRDVGPRDVRIDIAWAGICHSDIHTVRGDWGQQSYPLTVGHEIAGVVAEVGSDVAGLAVGDRVGVGCMVGSCRACDNCLAGRENYCDEGFVDTYGAVDRDGTITQGGYSSSVVVDEHFVLALPEAIAFDTAAPLLCAGITTYSPLKRWGAGPGTRVAVVGMGGLGHMAVKLAVAMGAEVTVLSRTSAKRADALELGAAAHHATSDPAVLGGLSRSFDLIINTVSAPLDVDAYLETLAFGGVMANVGAPPEPAKVSLFRLFTNQRSFTGSTIGGIPETQEMLEFCAEHGIAPGVEVIDASQVNDAWERVLKGDVRYRFVIDAATIGQGVES